MAAAYSNSKGWYVKERDGKFARQAGHWVKLSRRGLTDKYSNRAINTTVNGKQVALQAQPLLLGFHERRALRGTAARLRVLTP